MKDLRFWIIFFVVSVLFLSFFVSLGFAGPNDVWKSCCSSNDCNYKPGDPPISFGGKTYVCCSDGWKEGTSCPQCTSSNDCPYPNVQDCFNGQCVCRDEKCDSACRNAGLGGGSCGQQGPYQYQYQDGCYCERSPPCNLQIDSLTLSPSSTNQCGQSISLTATVSYSNAQNCDGQQIIVKKPDGNELCRINIDTSKTSGSCSGNYNVPSASGTYTFTATYGSQSKTASLTANCQCNLVLDSLTLSPSSTNQCGQSISLTATVSYSNAQNCDGQQIIVKKPDNTELCRITVSSSSTSGSCSGSYNVPSTSGTYTFTATYGSQSKTANLSANCCGKEGQPCCNAQPPCSQGLICLDGVCVKPETPVCSNSGTFSNRCPTDSSTLTFTCGNNEVCVYKITCAQVEDNVGRLSDVINSGYYCIDKRNPYFEDIYHNPQLISKNDSTYDPWPNYYKNKDGSSVALISDRLVIDKEAVSVTVKARDVDQYGVERSGIKTISFSFLGQSFIQSFGSTCPSGATYNPPASHTGTVNPNLQIGWATVTSTIYDQADNSASNNNYQFHVFLGARGDQQGQSGTDKIVFLKTYWDSVNEVKQRTNNLGGQSSKKINCFGYTNKCTFIRDIIGKTDEFTDCLWVGPSNNPTNVRIYSFKEGVVLDTNSKLNPTYYKDFGNRIVFAWQDIAPVNSKIAFCSKNDTGILVDLPNLIDRDIKNGFQILPSTEKRFSVIWQVEYAREQREVFVECYLNPVRNDGYTVCTIDDILNNRYGCTLDAGQKCNCGNAFPCIQDTSKETIQSCSVENPRYFSGTNRIICRFYDPRDKGIRAEVWFNHEFYFMDGIVFSEKEPLLKFLEKLLENFTNKYLKIMLSIKL